MTKNEREILASEEEVKKSVEEDIKRYRTENTEIRIKDIQVVGDVNYTDKINGEQKTGKVYRIQLEKYEYDQDRITNQDRYYLDNNYIGADLGDGNIIYKETFANSEPDKLKKVETLMKNTSEEEIEKTSMNKLQTKEIAEILSVAYGRKVTEEETKKLLENKNKEDIEEIKNSKDKDEMEKKLDEKGINLENKNAKSRDEELSKKQMEKINLSAIEKVDLNRKVDGMETLGKRLDLDGYDNMYVVYTSSVDNIKQGERRENTTYTLVGVRNDGTAKVLNDEFEMDRSVGNSGSREQTKIRANSTATRDNRDSSVFTRKSNGMSIGCENDMGEVNLFMYQKTHEGNENVGIQIETSKTGRIPIETKEVMNRNKGTHQEDKVQDEVQEHTDNGHEPVDITNADGDEQTVTDEHGDTLEKDVQEIYNEGRISEVFTEEEVKEKLLKELEENGKDVNKDQIIENVKAEMNEDAENLSRGRDREEHSPFGGHE